MSLLEPELLSLLEHLSSASFLWFSWLVGYLVLKSGYHLWILRTNGHFFLLARVAQYLVFCVAFRPPFCSFFLVLFLLAIELSVLRNMTSDYHYILKPLLRKSKPKHILFSLCVVSTSDFHLLPRFRHFILYLDHILICFVREIELFLTQYMSSKMVENISPWIKNCFLQPYNKNICIIITYISANICFIAVDISLIESFKFWQIAWDEWWLFVLLILMEVSTITV